MLIWKQFDELRHADPFRPFRIVLSDGAKFLVPHRDYVWRSPLGTMVFVAIDNGEVAHFIDPLHITRFELAKQNGRKKIPKVALPPKRNRGNGRRRSR